MRKRALLFALALSTGLASTAYAGTWFKDEGRWAYQQDDGTQFSLTGRFTLSMSPNTSKSSAVNPVNGLIVLVSLMDLISRAR